MLSCVATTDAITHNPDMTLIAAMKCEDCILLGADSLATEFSGLKLPVTKYGYLTDKSEFALAWGTTGDGDFGEAFTVWFKENASPFEGWDDVRKKVRRYLNEINKHRRKDMEEAGVKAADNDLVSILLVGYIDGQPDIRTLLHTGQDDSVLKYKFWALGSEAKQARLVYSTLRDCLSKLSPSEQPVKLSLNEHSMRIIMETAVLRGSGTVGFPIALLDIRKDRVTQLENIQQPPLNSIDL